MDHRRINESPGWWLLCVALALLAACGNAAHDPRLSAVNSMADEDPAKAIAMLDSIDKSTLNDYNRRYYDLLRIKTADKAYMRHTSDSLYQTVLGFFENKKGDPLYPEVIYYGGRVYSDLGDYPRALQYFQKSLELIPDDDANLQLRLNALSQTGRLLTKLRLYEEAKPYLQECINIDKKINDTVGLFYDYQLIGNLYRTNKEFAKASDSFNNALNLTKTLGENESVILQVEKAILKYMQNDIDSAICYIRNKDIVADSLDKDYIRTYQARIYYKAGIIDSAMMYAKKCIGSNNLSYRRSAYSILLSDSVRNNIPEETKYKYLQDYIDVLNSINDENQRDAYILQNSQYNYSIFEKENIQLLEHRNRLWICLFICMAVVAACLFTILLIKYRNSLLKRKYLNTLVKLKELNDKLENLSNSEICINVNSSIVKLNENIRNAKEKLDNLLLSKKISINPYLNSKGYQIVADHLENKQNISDHSPLWKEINGSFNKVIPSFWENLYDISNINLNDEERKLIILIRYGLKSTQISIILSKVKGTITYRRNQLANKLFPGLKDFKNFEKIIRLL